GIKTSGRAQREAHFMTRVMFELLNEILDCEVQIRGCRDIDVFCMERNSEEQHNRENRLLHNRPKNTQQTSAPTTLMESPQIMSLLKRLFRSTLAAAFA